MTTENIVQDTEESRIAQQKRETLHSLLYIMAECAPSAEKFMGIDVKALARKVDEAYDQLGLKITTDSGSVSPLKALPDTQPSDNVRSMSATVENVACADAVNVGSRPSYVTNISFGEIGIINGHLKMDALISWSDGSKTEKSVWCGSLATPKGEAERIARERIWLYATTKDEQSLIWITYNNNPQRGKHAKD